MTIRMKLSLGLGFLFLIILTLTVFCSYNIERLSQDADSMLRDNYDSLVLSRNMIAHLDDIRDSMSRILFDQHNEKDMSNYYLQVFESSRIDFDKDLKAENNNITEIHEKEYVEQLSKDYAVFLDLCDRTKKSTGNQANYFSEFLPAYEKLKKSINAIYDLNMQAVERKNLASQLHSEKLITNMNLFIVTCIFLAFGYFWYFPFYISNTISVLSDKMKKLLKKNGIELDTSTSDETYVLLHGIKLLEIELDKKK
jgi:hypothetical protein